MRRLVFAANWKMHYGPGATAAFIETFLGAHPPVADRTVILFPPSISLEAAARALATRSDIVLGVQNVYWEERGAFTGEISAAMAFETGARVALVGHSERRHLFGETDAMTARKCAAVLRAGLTPLLCVGERLEERERDETREVVLRQLDAGLSLLDAAESARIMVAYEPVWAIGTGRTASPLNATEAHAWIRGALHERSGEAAARIPILYGGSVNGSNAGALLAAPEVDGLLVGGASLDPAGWAALSALDPVP